MYSPKKGKKIRSYSRAVMALDPQPRVFISGYANTGNKFSIAFIKYLSRIKSAKTFLFWHWLKEKFLPVAKSCTCYQFLFCKKMLFKIRIFLAYNISLSAKKFTQLVCKDFPGFQPTKEWMNIVNLSNFELKKFVFTW